MAADVSTLFTFDEFLTHWAEDRPDQVALREEDRVFTYGEVEDRTARVASALLGAGLKKGDRIAWIGKNRSEEHTSELQSLLRISYAVFCLKTKHRNNNNTTTAITYDPN